MVLTLPMICITLLAQPANKVIEIIGRIMKRRKNTLHNECPRYDTKQSDDEVPVMQELWGMRSSPLLPSLDGAFWLGMVAPDRVLSMGQTELNYGYAKDRTILMF